MTSMLVFSPSYHEERQGGIDKVTFEMSKLDKVYGHKVYIVTLSYRQGATINERQCSKSNAWILEIPCSSSEVHHLIDENFSQHKQAIFKFIKDSKIEIVISHDWFLGGVACNVAEQLKIPLFTIIHSVKYQEYEGELNFQRHKIHNRQVQLCNLSTRVICLAENVKESITPFVSKDIPINVIRCGMNPPQKATSTKENNQDIKIYYHGRFSSEKNVLGLLDSFKRLPSCVRLILRGKGKLENELRNFINENGISDRVEIRPWSSCPNLISEDLRDSDIFVLPSRYEPLGLSLLEAVEHGVPAVMPHNFGPLEIYDELEAGWTFSNESTENSLTQVLLKAVKDKDYMRARLSVNKWQCYKAFAWSIGHSTFTSLVGDTLSREALCPKVI